MERMEGQLALLRVTDRLEGEHLDGSASFALAKDFEVDRLTFPPPPSFVPAPFLDSQLRRLYLQPAEFRWTFEEASVEPPRVRVRTACKQARMDLLARLDKGGAF